MKWLLKLLKFGLTLAIIGAFAGAAALAAARPASALVGVDSTTGPAHRRGGRTPRVRGHGVRLRDAVPCPRSRNPPRPGRVAPGLFRPRRRAGRSRDTGAGCRGTSCRLAFWRDSSRCWWRPPVVNSPQRHLSPSSLSLFSEVRFNRPVRLSFRQPAGSNPVRRRSAFPRWHLEG